MSISVISFITAVSDEPMGYAHCTLSMLSAHVAVPFYLSGHGVPSAVRLAQKIDDTPNMDPLRCKK